MLKFRVLKESETNFEIQEIVTEKKITISRKEFEETLEKDTAGFFTLKPETENIVEQMRDIASKAVVAVLGSKSPSSSLRLQSITTLSNLSERYCTLGKCTPMEFIKNVKLLMNNFMEGAINKDGVSFDEKYHQIPENLREKNLENKKKLDQDRFFRESYKKPIEKDDTKCSIGDIIKGKSKRERK